MKKYLFSVLFAVFAFSQTAFAELFGSYDESEGSDYSEPEPPPPPPMDFDNSIFVSVNAGYAYLGMDGTYGIEDSEDEDSDVKDVAFSGAGMAMDVNAGLNILRLFAVYVGAGFKVGSGSFDVGDDTEKSYTEVAFSYYAGFAAYPFRSNRFLKGMYGALEVGNLNFDVYRSKKVLKNPVDDNFYNFRIKFGYVFDISRRLSLGLTTYLELGAADSSKDIDEAEEFNEPQPYSLGVLFTFMRR